MKNLRFENEYFQKQLEVMRQELEKSKSQLLRTQQQQQRARSLDRNSGHSDGFGCAGLSTVEHNYNNTPGRYEPNSHLP